jgi:hypothetical protein
VTPPTRPKKCSIWTAEHNCASASRSCRATTANPGPRLLSGKVRRGEVIQMLRSPPPGGLIGRGVCNHSVSAWGAGRHTIGIHQLRFRATVCFAFQHAVIGMAFCKDLGEFGPQSREFPTPCRTHWLRRFGRHLRFARPSQRAELSFDCILCGVLAKRQSRNGNHDQQHRSSYRIESDCRAPAQRFTECLSFNNFTGAHAISVSHTWAAFLKVG